MSRSRLHVTFGDSAAGSLKMALARSKRSGKVVSLPDDFSIGPIDPGDPEQRADWEREELDEEEPIATSTAVARFWKRVSSSEGKVIVWMSSHSVVELCGLHALVWRLPDANIHVVNVAKVKFRRAHAPSYDERQAFAIVRDDRIEEHCLFEAATPLGDRARASIRKRWRRLRRENAPLRVLTDNGLMSAPIDYFDDRIRSHITDKWQPCSRVVGGMLRAMSHGRLVEFHSDTFIFARLLQLIDEGNDLELGHDDDPCQPWSMATTFVRRRSHG